MSGILAQVLPPGRTTKPALLAAMAARAPERGLDGFRTWNSGEAALGHQMLRTTPGDGQDAQPATHAGAGLTLVLDGVLHGRDELIDALVPATSGSRERLAAEADADLILRAYAAWGSECLERLVGDYAFVLWDARARRLLAAVDLVPMRPLFYHWDEPGGELLIASEETQLLAAPSVRPELDPRSIRGFLLGVQPSETTFVAGIRRLPGGHALELAGGRLRRWSWWRQPASRAAYRRDAEYAEHFASLFRASVAATLRAPGPVGCWLSGGVDSSSVAAMAADLAAGGTTRLVCLSAVFDGLPCDEREYSARLVARHGLPHHLVPLDNEEMLATAASYLSRQLTPYIDPNITLLDRMTRATRDAGCRVYLTGSAGDLLLGWPGLLEGRFQRLRWISWWRELRAFCRATGRDFPRMARGYPIRLARRAAPWWGGRQRREALELVADGDSVTATRARWRDWFTSPADPRPVRTAWTRFEPWQEGDSASVWGLWNRAASRHGVEMRDPFLNRRLIEFMYSVPEHLYLSGGLTKVILRETMRGLLPEEIRMRTSKAEFTPFLDRGLRGREAAALRSIAAGPLAARRYVREDAFRAWARAYLAGRDVQRWHLWYALSLELWLREHPDLVAAGEGVR